MADYTISISNSVNCFGGSWPTTWGNAGTYTMTWGASKWGQGTNPIVFNVEHTADVQTITGSTILSFDSTHLIENSWPILSETTSETLTQGAWAVVLPNANGTNEGENRVATPFTEVANDTESWTENTTPSTTWS